MLVMERRRVARNYLRGWFTIDLLSTFPFELFELWNTSSSLFHQLVRVARLLHLLRVLRFVEILRRVHEKTSLRRSLNSRLPDGERIHNLGFKRLIVISALALFAAHLVACLWYLLAKLNGFGGDTWVAQRSLSERGNAYKYLVAFYWSVQTITTVGFGDVGTASASEMILSLVWMLLGVGFYSFVMGSFTSIIASIDREKAKLRVSSDHAGASLCAGPLCADAEDS